MTNFDAIKDLTMDQMAAWLADVMCASNGCEACPASHFCLDVPRGCCAMSFKYWLSEEV